MKVSLSSIALLSALALGAAIPAAADTMYAAPQVKIGLHQDKSLDSPITKLVTSGASLEVLKREDPLSYVRDSEGATGWIDNTYLSAEAGGSTAQLKEALDRGDVLERRLADAQQQIASLSAGKGVPAPQSDDSARKQDGDVAQQLKEERLKSGELQVQLAELKKRLGVNNENESLYQRILELEADNKRMQVLLSGSGAGGASQESGASSGSGITLPTGNLATGLIVALLAGLLAGLYIMDYLNRRRHGGFRV